MERITSELSEQFAKSKELEDQIRKSLEGLGYGAVSYTHLTLPTTPYV
ncbi:hypothetical protein CDFC105_30040 [Clostridioides difficile]|nr:hypothetical protein CDFC105_30040 [Clostridioides difficile]